MDSDELIQRNKRFIIAIIEEIKQWPQGDVVWIISKQLLRSSTSVGANYRAALRSRSRSEFHAKLCIIVEEIDETNYWIDLVDELLPGSEHRSKLLKESKELLFIYSASRKTAKKF